MRFVDTLNQSSLSEQRVKETTRIKDNAITLFVNDLESAIKRETTTIAKQGKKSLSGFCARFHGGYSGNPFLGFVDEWNDDEKCTAQLTEKYGGGCPNIYRVDRIESGFLECRYGGLHGNPSSRNTLITLSDEDLKGLCRKVESMIEELGFTRYKVSLIDKQFYLIEETTTHGLFGGIKKHKKKHNDGMGKILHIEIQW